MSKTATLAHFVSMWFRDAIVCTDQMRCHPGQWISLVPLQQLDDVSDGAGKAIRQRVNDDAVSGSAIAMPHVPFETPL